MSYSLPVMVDYIPGIIYVWDHTAKTIQWCNKNFETRTGHTLSELKAMKQTFFGTIMYSDRFLRGCGNKLTSTEKKTAGVCRIRDRQDHKWHWFYGVAAPLNYDNEERIRESICILQELKRTNTPVQMHQAINFILKSELKDLLERLTKREKEVFDLLLQGKKDSEIAHHLFIATTTLKSHKKHTREKLGPDNFHLLIDLSRICRGGEDLT